MTDGDDTVRFWPMAEDTVRDGGVWSEKADAHYKLSGGVLSTRCGRLSLRRTPLEVIMRERDADYRSSDHVATKTAARSNLQPSSVVRGQGKNVYWVVEALLSRLVQADHRMQPVNTRLGGSIV